MTYRFVLFFSFLFITQNSSAQLFGDQQVLSENADGSRSVYSADLDGDGDIDVLSASRFDNKIAWYENQGGGVFSDEQVITTEAISARAVHAADLDGDGDMDVLSASATTVGIAWYENQGGGVFGEQQVISAQQASAYSVYSTDLDGDGDMDVISGAIFSLTLYENQGGGLFSNGQIISAIPFGSESVNAADLDGDGDMDVLSALSEEGIDLVSWYENQGGGLYSDQQVISTQAIGVGSVFPSDLDGDGDMDVLSASDFDDEIVWFENLGSGEFGDKQIISTESDGATSAHAADLDNDGDMDVIASSYFDNKIAWYENLGGGLFSNQEIISIEAEGAYFVHTADLDGDGNLDVLSASGVDDKISWYENLSGGGCIDPGACNYDPGALVDDGSCCYECGCTVLGAANYNSSACFDDGSCQFEVTGTVFFDENENGIMDGDDYGLPFQEVELMPNGLVLTTNSDGNFLVFASGNDQYTLTIAENPLFPFFTTPQNTTVDATQDNWNQETLYFGLSNEMPSFGLEVNQYPEISGSPCSNYLSYNLCFRNMSNLPIDVQVQLEYDSLFQSIIESALIDSLGENTAYLSFTDVGPFELICAEAELLSPNVDFIGEFLETTLGVQALYDGDEVAFESNTYIQELLCAYDPNDKHVFPEGYSEAHYIANDTILEYVVRFQNTGNAPAFDVIVRDTLDQNLELTTFNLVANSHPVFTTVNPNTRELEFYFQNIMLPDSVNSEPESHGFVSFTIRPESGLPLLTELNNTAAIYFDNNPPIITNTTWSTIYDCSLFDVSFTENGAVLTASEGDHYQWFLNGEPIEGATQQEYIAVEDGNYSVQVDIDFPCSDNSGSTFIIATNIQEWQGMEVKLFPNPMTTSATLNLGELNGPVKLEIYDIVGKMLRSELVSIQSGTLMLDRGMLSNGAYILRLTHEDETLDFKFIVE